MIDTIEQLLEQLAEMGLGKFSLHIDIDTAQPDAQIAIVVGGAQINRTDATHYTHGRQIAHGDGDTLPDALWNLADALDDYEGVTEIEGFAHHQIDQKVEG